MSNRSPIYNMLHQEIKTSVDQLLELSLKKESPQNKDQILGRLSELHQFASKVRRDGHYDCLEDFKNYLENTMLGYQDERHRSLTMRLSEAICLLGVPAEADVKFKPAIVRSLANHFLKFFFEEAKPGQPLHRKLMEIKRI